MSNNEKKLREGSKAFKSLVKLRKHVEECFEKGDYKYVFYLNNRDYLENKRDFVIELNILIERFSRQLRTKNSVRPFLRFSVRFPSKFLDFVTVAMIFLPPSRRYMWKNTRTK